MKTHKSRPHHSLPRASELGSLLQEWLDDKENNLAYASFTGYRSKAAIAYRYLRCGSLHDIGVREIRKLIRSLQKHYSNKTINEVLIVLRGAFGYAFECELIERNPMSSLKNLPVNRSAPEPFSSREVIQILACSKDHFQTELALFQVGIRTGLRISELLALAWSDVDLDRGQLNVRRARVKGRLKVPKTRGSHRTVDLPDGAARVLKNLYSVSGAGKPVATPVVQNDNRTVRKERLSFVFLNSLTGRPIANEGHYAKYFFKPLLASAGVKYRGPSTVRHTFASQMLTAGLPLGWIARQMGHNSTQMIEKHYGAWIADDSPDFSTEANSHFDRVFAPETRHELKNDRDTRQGKDRKNVLTGIDPELLYAVLHASRNAGRQG